MESLANLSPATVYQQKSQEQSTVLVGIQKRYNVLSYARLLIFLLGVGLTYLLFQWGFWMGMLGGIASLLGFLYLVRAHTLVADERAYAKRREAIILAEIETLEGRWHQRDAGNAFVDPGHDFAFDLDIFGRGSLFQYLNRTGTMLGRQRLADRLKGPETDPEAVLGEQAGIRELSGQLDHLLRFEALGMEELQKKDESVSILNWLDEQPKLLHHRWFPAVVRFMPWIFALALAGWLIPDLPVLREMLGGWHLPGWVPGFVFLANLGIVGRQLSHTSTQHNQVGRKADLLRTFAVLFKEIESLATESPRLREEQERLGKGDSAASQAIERLGGLSYMLDQRLNMIAGILLNGVLLWDLRYIIRLEKWRETHRTDVVRWFEVLAKWDASASLARFAWNHPAFAWPEVNGGDFRLEADGLGHPLLDPASRVDNDVSIPHPGAFLIVTGANMAGKSTFLRTVGVSLILAGLGAPVCARRYQYSPLRMMTSIRNSDSLADHESYFYAELKRLKRIIDHIRSEGNCFVIVDEMLRGTNSRDKQTGSRRFIEQLIQLKAVGLIATHDLALGKLAETHPGMAINKRFEVDIQEERLDFDYKLRDGISQNLNATFLMEQMGIM